MKPSKESFQQYRNARRGTSHAEDMTNPFWVWCVNSGSCGFTNNEAFDGESSFDVGPCWSFDRFGKSETLLADGQIVHIGGEHEDSYDPDFYIYNDITVIGPDGEIAIYGYPESDFPPTDFHSATLVGNEIILIGSLSYFEHRKPSKTQVLRVNTSDWSIIKQETKNPPGWISRHESSLDPDTQSIRITNPQKWTSENGLIDDFSTWALDLPTWTWKCVEQKNWNQYRLGRIDGKMNNLWDIRNHIEMSELGFNQPNMLDALGDDIDAETKASIKDSFDEIDNELADVIAKTNLDLLPELYRPSTPHKFIEPPEIDFEDENDDDLDMDYNHHRIEVEGVLIRFIEESDCVIMRSEGQLPEAVVTTILDEVCQKLTEFESTEYSYTQIS